MYLIKDYIRITIIIINTFERSITVSDKKLVIQKHKYTEETIVTSMRIPKDLLADLDKAARESNRTRNEILMMCLEFALENMEIRK